VTDCQSFQTAFEAWLDGSDAELGSLLEHGRACAGCGRLLELHHELLELAGAMPEPSAGALDAVQHRVVARLGRQRVRVWRLAAGLAASVLLFCAGFAASRLAAPAPLVRALQADAASNLGLHDVAGSRFSYSNVSFRPREGDQVQLDFDVTTHVQLVEPVQSVLAREVLVQSLINPSSVGSRLKAIGLAGRAMEPKVLQALILALRHDDSLAVRLKALSMLATQLDVPEVPQGVLDALRDDESVQLRLQALDYLNEHSVDRAAIRQRLEENRGPGGEALRVRQARLDRKL
jgi:hypothetical protein